MAREVLDGIMRGLKEARAYRRGKLKARTTKVTKIILSEAERRYLLRLLKAAPRPKKRLIELLSGTDVRVDWTVWKRSLGKFSPDFMAERGNDVIHLSKRDKRKNLADLMSGEYARRKGIVVLGEGPK